MADISFAAFTTLSASTERSTLTSGYQPHLVGISCTPLYPVDTETRQRLALDTPNILLETHVQDNPDIKAGDKLVIGSRKYYVKAVEAYTWLPTGDVRMRIVLEDLYN